MVADNSPGNEQQADAANKITDVESPKVIHRLPRAIWLGKTVKVKVKLVTPEFMKTVAPGGHELDGLWDDVNNLIYIDKTLSLREQWETLRHELLHAIIDIDHEERLEYSASNTGLKAAVHAPSKTLVKTSCVPPAEVQGTAHAEVDAAEIAS